MERADSIYQKMTPYEKVSELILVKASEKPYVDYAYGGIYYDQPLIDAIPNSRYLSVVQLDERLDPFPSSGNQLPNLYTLASLTQEDIISSYLGFFESLLKHKGVDICVVPPIDDWSAGTGKFVKKMLEYDPQFFIQQTELSFDSFHKKKELITLFKKKSYWVIPKKDATKITKKLEKQAGKILSSAALGKKVKATIASRISPTDLLNQTLPNQLAVAVSKGSVVPLQKSQGIFPLRRDTVCFLSNQPYSATANMLRKYAYVMTAYADIAQSNAPIIIDDNAYIPNNLLSDSRQIIFIGHYNNALAHIQKIDAALIYTQPSDIYSYVIPQQLFGATDITGRLTVRDASFSAFDNAPITGLHTLGYMPSSMMGLDKVALQRIDEIMQEAISSGSTPGAQLAIAVDGAIVLDQAYGYLTYDSLLPADRSTLYDLASVTKVMGTLLAVMKLYEDGQLNLDLPLGAYLDEFKNSNKENITLRALLSHNAGLKPYVPFWQKVLSTDLLETFYYEDEADRLADKRSYGIRPNPNLRDTLNSWIVNSPLINYDSVPSYSYSDIGFMILHQVVESVSGQSMDEFLSENFYQPLRLKRLAFNPLDHGFERFEIAPTEHDYYFRDELVWGEVHDRNAAVFGGVAGHAGLFSNAGELLVILQTLLQDGSYGGQNLLQPATIAYFNQQFYPNNRRALGWDKKDDRIGNASLLASADSFGHTGFTGTIVWADPKFNLAFVFLSNRIHPNSNNYKLIQKNIRTRLQDVVYEALMTNWIK